MRDLGQMLAHVHDAEIGIGERGCPARTAPLRYQSFAVPQRYWQSALNNT
jgi:hypothetical protein